MSGDGSDALSFVYLIGLLTLVGSALMVRRIPISQGLKMAAAWVLIFGAVFVGFTLKDDFIALGQRIVGESRSAQTIGQGGELRVKRSADDHFWVEAELNGERVRFLVDSGATVTSISEETARRAGIERSGSYPVIVDTANGMAEAWRGRADRLAVGSIERTDFPVHIAAGLGETDLLGMNFLSTLSEWRVEGQWLVLKP